MTRTEHADILQGTDEWHKLRLGILTASTFAQVITPSTLKVSANDKSRALVRRLAAERITGHAEETPMTRDMERGHLNEPLARADYTKRTERDVQQIGFMTYQTDAYTVGWSPDGLVGSDGCIEIKSPRDTGHIATILTDKIPAAYVPQVQAAMWIGGRKWCDYVSYCGGLPTWIIRAYPDPKWQAALDEAAREFEQSAAEVIAAYTKAVEGLPTTKRIDWFADVEI